MIVDSLINAFRGAANLFSGTHPRDPKLAKLWGVGKKTFSGVDVDELKSLGYPAVFRAVSLISQSVMKLPVAVMRKDGKRRVRDPSHFAWPLVRLRTNDEMTFLTLRETLQHFALLWGNGVAHIFRNAAGEATDIIPLLPDRTWPVRLNRDGGAPRFIDSTDVALDETRNQLMYATRVAGKIELIRPENVLHIKGLGFNGIWGYPVVELLRESIGVGLAARQFGAEFFGRGATGSGFMKPPPGMDQEELDNYWESFQKQHAGLGRAHKVILLEEGMDFQSLTVPPEHAQFLQTREFEIREVANIFGVQPHKLGDPSRKSFNSLEQSNQEFLDDGLEPWLCKWETELQLKLLREREINEDTHSIEFDRRALVRANLAAQTSHFSSGRQWGWYSANDIRDLLGQDPIENGGDIYLEPANMREAGTAPPPETATRAEDGLPAHVNLIRGTVERMSRRLVFASIQADKSAERWDRWINGDIHLEHDAISDILRGPLDAYSEASGEIDETISDRIASRIIADVRTRMKSLKDTDQTVVADTEIKFVTEFAMQLIKPKSYSYGQKQAA